MAVSVQLPGFQNHEAPINNIAGLAGAISNIATGFKQRANLDQDTQAKTLANQQAQTAQDVQKAQMAQMNDPSTPLSNIYKKAGIEDILTIQNAGGVKNGPDKVSPLADALHIFQDPNTTGLQAQQLRDQMKPILDVTKEQLSKDASLGASLNKSAPQIDRMSRGVGDDYLTRTAPYKGVQDDISKIESTLNTKDKNGKPLITSQQLGDANLAISRIYSPTHQSDSTVSATEYESIPQQFAAAIQKLKANPTDINSRALIEHIIDQAHHIGNVSNQNAIKQINDLDSANNNLMSPATAATAKSTSKQLRSRFNKTYTEAGENLKQPPNGLSSVTQGGHQFNWNPQSGKYE